MDQNNQENRVQIAGAIMPASSVRPPAAEPRVRNLQGLLRFAMDATRAEDAPNTSDLSPLDIQRRRFLEEALKSVTVNVVDVLQKAIKVLTDKEKIMSIQLGEKLPDDVETAFDKILSYIDDMDVANDFYNVGGFAIFPICFSSENDDIRCYASQVLAELCQNNPFCQARALECGLLNIVLHMMESEQGDTLSKCVSAVSSITRQFEPACRELTAQNGCESLTQVLATAEEIATKTRCAFLITYLCQNYIPAKEKFIELNIVRIIAEQVKKERTNSTEHLLSIIHCLLEDQRIVQQCREPELDLKSIVEEHLKRPDLDPFLEERQHCLDILKILDNVPNVDAPAEADR